MFSRSLLEHELSKNNLLNDAKSIINYSDEKIVKLISLLYDMDFQDNCVIFVSDGETAQVVTHIFEVTICNFLLFIQKIMKKN